MNRVLMLIALLLCAVNAEATYRGVGPIGYNTQYQAQAQNAEAYAKSQATANAESSNHNENKDVNLNANKNGDNDINIEGDTDNSVQIIEENYPVNSAPSSFAGPCSSGGAYTDKGVSFSMATSSAFCQHLEMYSIAIDAQDYKMARKHLNAASGIAMRDGYYDNVRSFLTIGIL